MPLSPRRLNPVATGGGGGGGGGRSGTNPTPGRGKGSAEHQGSGGLPETTFFCVHQRAGFQGFGHLTTSFPCSYTYNSLHRVPTALENH